MEYHCPACGNPMGRNDVVCPACLRRIEAREPARRESILYGWGRGLMLVLAMVLFLKAALATLSPSEYGEVVRSLGIARAHPTAQFLNAAFMAAAALVYAVAWAGSYVGRRWDRAACLLALVVFLVGQAGTRGLAAASDGQWAQALALFCVWVAIPIFQYCSFRLGRPDETEAPPRASSAEPVRT